MSESGTVEGRLKDIKRRTRRKFNAEEKIRIVLEGIKGESSIAELCRREGIHANQYYTWSKEFLEAGKQRLNGNTVREATSPEVAELRKENANMPIHRSCLSFKRIGDEGADRWKYKADQMKTNMRPSAIRLPTTRKEMPR